MFPVLFGTRALVLLKEVLQFSILKTELLVRPLLIGPERLGGLNPFPVSTVFEFEVHIQSVIFFVKFDISFES